jgi:hypothetical protein
LPDGVGGRFGLHPVLLDAALHATALADGPSADLTVPFVFTGVDLFTRAARQARVRCVHTGSGTTRVDLFDPAGEPVASVESVLTRPLPTRDTMLYRPQWIPIRAVPAGDATRVVTIAGDGADARSLTGRALQVLHEWLPRGDRLVIATRNATGHDPDLAAAAVWGLGCSAAAEYPTRITMVDLDGDLPDHQVRALVGGTSEPQVAIRDGVPHALRIAHARPSAIRPIDPTGTVLITGGTGALGALSARHLVAEYGARHLVLVSRRGPDSPQADPLRAALTKLGADVRIVGGDVADRRVVRRLVDSCDPPLTAVVHTAAVVDDGVLAAQTPDRIDTVFRPKSGRCTGSARDDQAPPAVGVRAVLLGRGDLRQGRAGQLRRGQQVSGRARLPSPSHRAARPVTGVGAVGTG